MNFIEEQIQKIQKKFELNSDQPKITGKYNFYIDLVYDGIYPYQNCTISINAFSDEYKNEIIACSYIWKRESKHKSQIIENQKSNTFQLSFLDLGSTIKIEVTPQENQQNLNGTAYISFGPVKLDLNTQQALIGIVNSGGTKFPIEIITQQNNNSTHSTTSHHKNKQIHKNISNDNKKKVFSNNQMNNNSKDNFQKQQLFQDQGEKLKLSYITNSANYNEEYDMCSLILSQSQIYFQSNNNPDKQLKICYKIHDPNIQVSNDSRELLLIFNCRQQQSQDYFSVRQFLNLSENQNQEHITMKLRVASRAQRDLIALAIKIITIREYYKDSKIFQAIHNYFSFNEDFLADTNNTKLDSFIQFSQIQEECISLYSQVQNLSQEKKFLKDQLQQQEDQFKITIKSFQDLLVKINYNTNSLHENSQKYNNQQNNNNIKHNDNNQNQNKHLQEIIKQLEEQNLNLQKELEKTIFNSKQFFSQNGLSIWNNNQQSMQNPSSQIKQNEDINQELSDKNQKLLREVENLKDQNQQLQKVQFQNEKLLNFISNQNFDRKDDDNYDDKNNAQSRQYKQKQIGDQLSYVQDSSYQELIIQNEQQKQQIQDLKQKLFIKEQSTQETQQGSCLYIEKIEKLKNKNQLLNKKIESLQKELEKLLNQKEKIITVTQQYSPFKHKYAKKEYQMDNSIKKIRQDESPIMTSQSRDRRKNSSRISQLFTEIDQQKENMPYLANNIEYSKRDQSPLFQKSKSSIRKSSRIFQNQEMHDMSVIQKQININSNNITNSNNNMQQQPVLKLSKSQNLYF